MYCGCDSQPLLWHKRDPEHNPRYKTVLCHDYMNYGHCRFGATCVYAHGEYEKRELTPKDLAMRAQKQRERAAAAATEANAADNRLTLFQLPPNGVPGMTVRSDAADQIQLAKLNRAAMKAKKAVAAAEAKRIAAVARVKAEEERLAAEKVTAKEQQRKAMLERYMEMCRRADQERRERWVAQQQMAAVRAAAAVATEAAFPTVRSQNEDSLFFNDLFSFYTRPV
jgi:hypothetical protein